MPGAGESAVAPALAAFADLDRMVRHLGEELAFFRRRALDAERRVRELSASVAAAQAAGAEGAAFHRAPGEGVLLAATGGAVASAEALDEARARIAELEGENAELRARLSEAAARTRAMTDRLRFLRQQQEVGDER